MSFLSVRCQELVAPDNGMVSYDQSGQVYFAASYVCNDGYYLVGGDEMRTCQSDGPWSGTEPTCNEREHNIIIVYLKHYKHPISV